VEIRLVRSGIRSGPPIRGKASPNGVEREAARLFMQTLADGEALSGQPMPEIKIR
jgi:hypothetical protein